MSPPARPITYERVLEIIESVGIAVSPNIAKSLCRELHSAANFFPLYETLRIKRSVTERLTETIKVRTALSRAWAKKQTVALDDLAQISGPTIDILCFEYASELDDKQIAHLLSSGIARQSLSNLVETDPPRVLKSLDRIIADTKIERIANRRAVTPRRQPDQTLHLIYLELLGIYERCFKRRVGASTTVDQSPNGPALRFLQECFADFQIKQTDEAIAHRLKCYARAKRKAPGKNRHIYQSVMANEFRPDAGKLKAVKHRRHETKVAAIRQKTSSEDC